MGPAQNVRAQEVVMDPHLTGDLEYDLIVDSAEGPKHS